MQLVAILHIDKCDVKIDFEFTKDTPYIVPRGYLYDVYYKTG